MGCMKNELCMGFFLQEKVTRAHTLFGTGVGGGSAGKSSRLIQRGSEERAGCAARPAAGLEITASWAPGMEVSRQDRGRCRSRERHPPRSEQRSGRASLRGETETALEHAGRPHLSKGCLQADRL